MTDPVTACIFCGDTDLSRITWEHLWPRWSHKVIVRSMRKWHRDHGIERWEAGAIDNSGIRTGSWGGDVHDMQVHCVCGGDKTSCNNGWMRELENLARRILIPLMNGESARINPKDQQIIAGWAAMKAMVMEYTQEGHVTTLQAERDRLRTLQLPPEHGWGIWIGHYVRGDWPGYMGSDAFRYPEESDTSDSLGKVPPNKLNGQSSFQVVKQLFIQVIRCRVPALVEKWRFDTRALKSLRKIWPPSGISIVWPTPTMSDADADYTASSLRRAARREVQRRLAREAASRASNG